MLARWTLSRVQRTATRSRTLSYLHRSSSTIIPVKRVSFHQQEHNAVRSKILQNRRTFFTGAIPTVLIPPVIFTTLLLGLWTWKCFWIVLMQNKLLYIAWLPPFARSEKIADYSAQCGPVRWEEKQIRSLDGTKLAVCEGRMKSAADDTTRLRKSGLNPAGPAQRRKKRVVICYFQGNGGSTPMRLPLLSDTLRTATSATGDDNVEFIVVALSYRGYWTSSGRPTQSGIEQDAQAFLAWVSRSYAQPETELRLVLWGHSLGSAIASTALATHLTRPDGGVFAESVPITGLIMEAPTSSTKDMLISLYPQKWLPYRYLWPFLRSNWDSSLAMERAAKWRDQCRECEAMEEQDKHDEKTIVSGPGVTKQGRRNRSLPPILMLSAEKDEVIPPHAADQLEADARRLDLVLERKDVVGAMHTEAVVKEEGKKAMMNFLLESIKRDH